MGIVYFAIFVAILIAVIQNYEIMNYKTTIKFFHLQTPELPVAFLIVIAFAIGYVIGYIRSMPAVVKAFWRSREIERLSKRIEELETHERELQDKSQERQITSQSS